MRALLRASPSRGFARSERVWGMSGTRKHASSEQRIVFSGRRPLDASQRAALAVLLERVLSEHDEEGTVSVVFTDDDEIRRLHSEFFGLDSATDVITFPFDDDDPDDICGEVVVSVDTARREAKARDLEAAQELCLYALHGVLHLVGYDDVSPADRRRMRGAERKYMKELM